MRAPSLRNIGLFVALHYACLVCSLSRSASCTREIQSYSGATWSDGQPGVRVRFLRYRSSNMTQFKSAASLRGDRGSVSARSSSSALFLRHQRCSSVLGTRALSGLAAGHDGKMAFPDMMTVMACRDDERARMRIVANRNGMSYAGQNGFLRDPFALLIRWSCRLYSERNQKPSLGFSLSS
jgi:hypothetical protein